MSDKHTSVISSATIAAVRDVGKTERRGRKRGTTHVKGPRTELVLISPETPGYKLVRRLFEQAAARSMTMAEVANAMGVGESTLSHLRTGRRLASQLERDIMRRISEWLDLPYLAAMLMAEQLTLADFYSSGSSSVDPCIERALDFICSDPLWGSMVTKKIDHWDREEKLFVVWAFEKATGTRILAGEPNYRDLLGQLQAFRNEHPAVQPTGTQQEC